MNDIPILGLETEPAIELDPEIATLPPIPPKKNFKFYHILNK